MSEYYLIYRTEKGNPESETHATLIEGTLTLGLVKAIENELQKRYGNEAFDVILYKKEKLSVSDALKLKHLVNAYETAGGCYDYDFRGNRNRVLYEIEYWVADLKDLQDDPSVVWPDATASPTKKTERTATPAVHVEEYFVAYYQTFYPGCRTGCDGPLFEVQKSKPCFASSCGECEGRGPYCNWNDCHHAPYTCNTVDCPESNREVFYRVSIGSLTPEELEAFKELTGIEKYGCFSLLTREDIQRLSTIEKVKHNRAVNQFNKEALRRTIPGWDLPF